MRGRRLWQWVRRDTRLPLRHRSTLRGFQPVSGRATHRPRKGMIHGNGVAGLEGSPRGRNYRLEAYSTLRRRPIVGASWRWRQGALETSLDAL
jgi:hypothetical protein